MTLNIMLTSRRAVFLSGDFRLTYPDHWVDDLNAQKLIPIVRLEWSALVAFTGVAITPQGLDVGDWIASQLQGIPEEAPLQELANRLRAADAWLAQIGDRELSRLAISVVGFARRRPFAMLISNFTNLGGEIFPRRAQLGLEELRPKKPEMFIPGQLKTFLGPQREQLKALVAQKTPKEFLVEMAKLNAEAAEPLGGISPACVTGYLQASGKARIIPYGVPDGGYLPRFVQRYFASKGGLGWKPKYDENGMALPPRWVGMTAGKADKKGDPQGLAVLHIMRNIAEPTARELPPGTKLFWKVATGSDEAPVTLELGTDRKSRLTIEWP